MKIHWHRVTDADEIWLWHLGDPLLLSYSDERSTKGSTLGPDLNNNEELQAVIPKSIWQKIKSNGAWSLVSCVVAPATLSLMDLKWLKKDGAKSMSKNHEEQDKLMMNTLLVGIPSFFKCNFQENIENTDIAFVGVPHSTGNGTTERDQHLGQGL